MTILFLIALIVAALGSGLLLLDLLDRAHRLTWLERVAISYALGCFLIHLGVTLVGRIRLDAFSMSLTFLPFLALGLLGLIRQPLGEFSRACAFARTWPIDDKRLLCLLAVLFLANFLQGLAPPNDYDSLMYHLTLPQADIENGRIVYQYKYGLGHAFFPQLSEDMFRLALALAGEKATQLTVGLFAFACLLATIALALRMGADRFTALLAGLMFIAVRAFIWEAASAEVEINQTVYALAALLTLLAWLEHPSKGLAILLGLLLGAAFNVKYPAGANGIALALSLLAAGSSWKNLPRHLPLVLSAGLLAVLPQSFLNYLETGNPVFPLFNGLFHPDGLRFFDTANELYGTGRGLLDLLIGPVTLSVDPMRYYDGMVLGAPYLIAFMPLGFLSQRPIRHVGVVLTGLAAFYVIWFYLLSQQVRFLFPVTPQASVLAAIGAVSLWNYLENWRSLRGALLGLTFVLAVNQAMFVGIYAALRLPVALGLQSVDDYHRTPTLNGAFYATCKYMRDNLKPGERIISSLSFHSYYCPQAAAVRSYFPDEERDWATKGEPSPPDAKEFLTRFEAMNFRFVIIQKSIENRRNDTGAIRVETTDFSHMRLARYFGPAALGLTPLAEDKYSAVYDGAEVLERLRAGIKAQP